MHTVHMKVLLTCLECGHRDWGVAERNFMNKVKMWNHVRVVHPHIEADKLRLVMRTTFPYEYNAWSQTQVYN